MRIIVSSLEFKGTLTATEATAAMAEGICAALPHAEVIEKPMADGGPGTLDALLGAFGANERVTVVQGPLGQTVEARWAVLPDGSAVLETAQAIGLTLLPADHRNVVAATSFGAGQLLRVALHAGARRLFISLGGSGTNDGGRGLLEALGVGIDDQSGRVDVSGLDPRLAESELLVLLDVYNPLLGPNGATRAYGPQKGASAAQVDTLEARMERFAHNAEAAFNRQVRDVEGAGAAGGLGFALLLLGARPLSGASTIARMTGIEAALDGATALFTGEGAYDRQTAWGKGVFVLSDLARVRQVPVYAVFGRMSEPNTIFEEALSLTDIAGSTEQAMTRARELVVDAAARLARRLNGPHMMV